MLYLFVIGRILLGGFFLLNGYNHMKNMKMMAGYAGSKGVPMPTLAVFVTGLMLLLGGAGILLGVYVRVAILLLSIFLVGVSFKMHDYWNLEDPMQKMVQEINFKKNMAILGALLMISLIPLSTWAMLALF
ncbi:MAG: DoxX family membrane protein [Patescibacteria group bacterium]